MAQRFFFLCMLVFAVLPAFPQADVATATLKGTVSDESNAVIPGAKITVKDLDRGLVRETTSDATGVYQVRLLPPSAYEVRISAQGFVTRVMTRVELSVGQVGVYDAHLRVGADHVCVQPLAADTQLPFDRIEELFAAAA